MRWLLAMALLGLLLAACSHSPRESAPASEESSSADAAAIARDAPERIVMPLAPEGAGRVVVERVGVDRVAPAEAPLELAPPSAEPSEPPLAEAPREAADTDSLKPPIARGLPQLPSGGRGGRVTLDVRVDEQGEVTEVELVESDADSATIAAATRAAYDLLYHPALLGTRRVAVWCRQVFDVKRGR
jgi:outer membrane biosynthesis protein TonB